MDMQRDLFKRLNTLFPKFWEYEAGELVKFRSTDSFHFPIKVTFTVMANGLGYMKAVVKIHEPYANIRRVVYVVSIDLNMCAAELLSGDTALKFDSRDNLRMFNESLKDFISSSKKEKKVARKLEDVYRVWSFA